MHCSDDSVWPVSCNVVDAVPSFSSNSSNEVTSIHTDPRQIWAVDRIYRLNFYLYETFFFILLNFWIKPFLGARLDGWILFIEFLSGV